MSEQNRADQVSNRLTWAVVGASGFIGSAMVLHLESRGETVRKVSAPRLNLEPRGADGSSILRAALSMDLDGHLVEALVGVDVVINGAGLASPDGADSPELYGANALLPTVLARTAREAGVRRYIHLSSAAVQGDRPIIDESAEVEPFSPYSRSKALGEQALSSFRTESQERSENFEIVVIRATSVQGPSRSTTKSLRRIAASPLSSVASPGDQPSIVSSAEGLAKYVEEVGNFEGELPFIGLQPWEGLSVTDVLVLAGSREPIKLPSWLCRATVGIGKAIGRVIPRVMGLSRRVEVLWFGQRQVRSGFLHPDSPETEDIRSALDSEKSQA